MLLQRQRSPSMASESAQRIYQTVLGDEKVCPLSYLTFENFHSLHILTFNHSHKGQEGVDSQGKGQEGLCKDQSS